MNESLLDSVRNCQNLPTMPVVAMQVLDLAQRPDVELPEIAKIIGKDPALSSKILKTVNSSFYGRSQNVSSLSSALVILGLQSVKTLVLGFSLVSNLSQTKARGFKHLTYWKRSIYAATAARSIAARAGYVQQEESFLAALLMDIGMLVLDQVVGERYGEVCAAAAASHSDLPGVEMSALGTTHAEIAGFLTQQWKLPPVLSIPVQFHHNPALVTDPQLQKLAELVHLGARCADVFVDHEAAKPIADMRQLFEKYLGIGESEADALMSEIGSRTREVAGLFEINIGSTLQYEAILKKANEALIELTLQSQFQANQLEQQNQLLKEQVTKDALTGLSNRAGFDAFMAQSFEAAVRNKTPLSLLIMDLDKFKSINDTHGHPAGDAVLRAVGALISQVVRKQDLAGRYGGEEMVLVLPETPRVVASAIAESIRRAVAAKPVEHGTLRIPITASIGVAAYEPGCPFTSPEHLLKAADLAVYNAKHSGRNCVKVFAIKTTGATAA